jgi:hypothetical protein
LETAALVAASRKLDLAPDRKASLRAELDRNLEERSARHPSPKARRAGWWLPVPLAAVALGSLFLTLNHVQRSPEAASMSAPSAAALAEAPAVPPATAVADAQAPASPAEERLAREAKSSARDDRPPAGLAQRKERTQGKAGPPPTALLRAQADALAAAAAASRAGASDTQNVEATRKRLEHELSAYRSRLIASLDERLGTSREGFTGR